MPEVVAARAFHGTMTVGPWPESLIDQAYRIRLALRGFVTNGANRQVAGDGWQGRQRGAIWFIRCVSIRGLTLHVVQQPTLYSRLPTSGAVRILAIRAARGASVGISSACLLDLLRILGLALRAAAARFDSDQLVPCRDLSSLPPQLHLSRGDCANLSYS